MHAMLRRTTMPKPHHHAHHNRTIITATKAPTQTCEKDSNTERSCYKGFTRVSVAIIIAPIFTTTLTPALEMEVSVLYVHAAVYAHMRVHRLKHGCAAASVCIFECWTLVCDLQHLTSPGLRQIVMSALALHQNNHHNSTLSEVRVEFGSVLDRLRLCNRTEDQI